MTTADDLALQSVIHYHLNEAIRLMKATGEGADPIVWDEIRVYMPAIERKPSDARTKE